MRRMKKMVLSILRMLVAHIYLLGASPTFVKRKGVATHIVSYSERPGAHLAGTYFMSYTQDFYGLIIAGTGFSAPPVHVPQVVREAQ